MGYQPPYECFKDLGLGMNPRSSLPTQIFPLFLLVACFLNFLDWLHANYVGNVKYLILSLRSFEIHPELAQKWFTSEFVKTQTHMLIMCYSTLTYC